MSRARALVAVVLVVAAGLIAASPAPATLLAEVPRILLVSVVASVTARTLSRFVLGYPSQRGGVYPPRRARFLVVASATFVILWLFSFEAAASVLLPHPWLAELGRLASLSGAGVALARWCRSSESSPVYLATGLVVLLSVFAALRAAETTEAIPHAARLLMRLPQDAAVLWAAWHVAAIRGRL
jgi:hypothetical protein